MPNCHDKMCGATDCETCYPSVSAELARKERDEALMEDNPSYDHLYDDHYDR